MEARKTSQVDTNMAAGAPSSRSRRGSARSRLHEDKAGKAVRGPASHVDLCEGSRGKEWAQRPDSAVCTFSGVQNKKKSSRARPPPPSPPPLPPWLRWPAPLCASQGRFLSQLGVLGCVAACLYWSMDFLVAACTYLNIPPGHCSVFPASHSLPPPPPLPLPPPASSPTGCSASHPLSYVIAPSTHCPILSSTFPLFPVPRLSSPPWTGVFLTAPPALSPPDSVLTWMREKGRTVWSKKEAFQAHSQEITQCKTMATQLGLVGLKEK